jgi:Carboxypeptidase regulatory-like domain/TonB-dependent Receptor Plug Domain
MSKSLRFQWGFILFTWLFFIASAPFLSAQTAASGALTGTVTDASGAVIPNATVTATSVDTGQARTATTGSDGAYTIGLLPPGKYRVKFEASGFKPVEIPAATINVTETAVLDRSLEVGAQTQTVTVEGEVETIQTASSALGTVVGTTAVTALPLNTRNYTNLLTLSAGANAAVTNASFTGKGGTLIAVNGGGTAQNTYLQDGVPINNWFSFNTGAEGVEFGSFAIPIPDAIEEFKIQTSTYDAGYGRNPGANVNVITKSGTNSFHGSGFEFLRNSALNANDWIRNFQGLSKPVLNSNQFGGTFGGPIRKDKFFFFVSYQETRQKNGIVGYGSSSATLPPIPTGNRGTCPAGFTTPGQCDVAGAAFVPALASAVCTANHPSVVADNPQAGTLKIACPGGGGTPPLFNINPVAIRLLQAQLPSGGYLIPSSGTANYVTQTFSDPARFSDHNGMGNFDYVINSKHTLLARYDYEQDPTNSPFPTLNITLIGNTLPGSPVVTTKWNHNALLKLTSILSNTLVNEARVAYQRNVTIDSHASPFTDSQFGITPLNPGYDVLSYFTVGAGSGGFSFGPHYFFDGVFPENQFEWSDQVSWTRGKHSIRSGVEVERIQLSRSYPGNQGGNPTFPRFADFLIGLCASTAPGCTNSNGGPASNMTTAGNFTSPTAAFDFLIRTTDFNAFLQDDFKFNSRLTLNLGLRWEYDGLPYLKDGNFSNFWTGAAGAVSLPGSSPATGTLAGYIVPANYNGPLTNGLTQSSENCATQHCAPLNNFAPRIGFAWQPLSSNRWVVRGGAGFFYDLIGGQIFADGNPGVTPPGEVSPITPPSGATLANPWVLPPVVPGPAGTYGFPLRWVNTSTFANSGLSQTIVQQDLKTPLTYEWNLNTQYEFHRNWVLELGYVGSHGIHQVGQSRSGAQGQGTTIQGFNLAPLAGAGCTSCALTGATTNTIANAPARVPFLGLSPTDAMIASTSSYKYNSLQATMRKQLSYGLQLQGSYTWSRAFIALPFFINTYPYDVFAYEPNNNYRPHRFVLNYVWNLPLPHEQGWLGRVAEGWSLSGVFTIQDGTPLTITDGTGGSIFFGGQGANSTAQICPGMTYANLLTSGSLTQRVAGGLTPGGVGYLTKAGVLCAVPTIGNGTGFGNMGGGAVLGPGQNNWDMSLAKSFTIREGQSLQFRSEYFNTFNHAQFSNPTTVASAPNFGQISTTSVSPRIIQLALKFLF